MNAPHETIIKTSEHASRSDYTLFDTPTQQMAQLVYEAAKQQRGEFVDALIEKDAELESAHSNYEQLALERDALEIDSQAREATQRDRADRNPLTKLFNQEAFAERVNTALHKHDRQTDKDEPGMMFFIDLDFLKVWNDILTEPEVNRSILIPMATCLEAVVRSGDIVGHWGGDEFAIYTSCMVSKDAYTYAERIRAAINHIRVTNPQSGGPKIVGVSTGFTQVRAGEDYTDAEIRAARAKKYAKVELGRNEIMDYQDIPPGYDFSKLSQKSLAALQQ